MGHPWSRAGCRLQFATGAHSGEPDPHGAHGREGPGRIASSLPWARGLCSPCVALHVALWAVCSPGMSPPGVPGCVCSHRTKDSQGHKEDGPPDALYSLQLPRWRVVFNLPFFFFKDQMNSSLGQ